MDDELKNRGADLLGEQSEEAELQDQADAGLEAVSLGERSAENRLKARAADALERALLTGDEFVHRAGDVLGEQSDEKGLKDRAANAEKNLKAIHVGEAGEERSGFSQQLTTASAGGYRTIRERARKILVKSAEDGSLMPILRKVQGITPRQRARATLVCGLSSGKLVPALTKVLEEREEAKPEAAAAVISTHAEQKAVTPLKVLNVTSEVQGIAPRRRARKILVKSAGDGTLMPILRNVQGITPRQRARSSLADGLSSGKLVPALTKVLEEREEAKPEVAASVISTVAEEKAVAPLTVLNATRVSTSVLGSVTQKPSNTSAPHVGATGAPAAFAPWSSDVDMAKPLADAVGQPSGVTSPMHMLEPIRFSQFEAQGAPIRWLRRQDSTDSVSLTSRLSKFVPSNAAAVTREETLGSTPRLSSFVPDLNHNSVEQATRFGPLTSADAMTPRLSDFMPAEHLMSRATQSTPRLTHFMPAEHRSLQRGTNAQSTPRLTDFVPAEHGSLQRSGDAAQFVNSDAGSTARDSLMQFMPVEHHSADKGAGALRAFISHNRGLAHDVPVKQDLRQFLPIEYSYVPKSGTRHRQDSPGWTPRLTQFMP